MNNLFIVGTGGFAKEVWTYCQDCNYSVAGFIDINKKNTFQNLPVYGSDYIKDKICNIIIAIGNPHLRRKIYIELGSHHFYPNLIHPTSYVGKNVSLGRGVVVCRGATLTTDIKIGDFCQLHVSSTVGHDSHIGNYVTLCPHAVISGNVSIGDHVFLGANSTVIEKKKIVENVVVGANCCVIHDIEMNGTYVGVPAVKLKDIG